MLLPDKVETATSVLKNYGAVEKKPPIKQTLNLGLA